MATQTLVRLGAALKEMPAAAFDNSSNIRTRRWWEEWLRDKTNT
jgi:hypothetical protein